MLIQIQIPDELVAKVKQILNKLDCDSLTEENEIAEFFMHDIMQVYMNEIENNAENFEDAVIEKIIAGWDHFREGYYSCGYEVDKK